MIARTIKLKIKVVNQDKYLKVCFDYNLEEDSPEKIVSEMKAELGLPSTDLIRIKSEIEQIISKIQAQISLGCPNLGNSILKNPPN